ncbi:MAG TPA: 50S ribosomal protein L24 [Thermoanaerobaculia bacterium]|nr:50S ribosomal protein L24 [Thermoanaerobaculia bacterium]
MKLKIKKGDQVLVITGKNRGARGKVLRMVPAQGKAIVEGVNMIKRHTKPNPQRQIKGGVVEREAPIAVSKLMLIDPDSGKPTRVGWKRNADGTVSRVAKVSGAVVS